jgi:hypothetical protein
MSGSSEQLLQVTLLRFPVKLVPEKLSWLFS